MKHLDGTNGKIREMVLRVVERFQPDEVILFGSHARGEAGPDSDVDLLVIMPVEGSRRETAIRIGTALADIPIPKDIVVFTPEDKNRYGDMVGTILRPALREGIVLYERS